MSEDLHFLRKDRPLRDDVSRLGALLGRVIREQGGDELFYRVELARRAARRRRRGQEKSATALLERTLGGLGPDEALETVQAFAQWFDLVNLAERVHRVRRRLSYRRNRELQPASLGDVVARLLARGLSREDLRTALEEIAIEPVFTAHPTEAVRPAILTHEQRNAERLLRGLRTQATALGAGDDALIRFLEESIAIVWRTEEQRVSRPSVDDEAQHVLFYVAGTLYDEIAEVEAETRELVRRELGGPLERRQPLISCASWVGGDMDGNPNVGPDTIESTLARHRRLILERYVEELGGLAEVLTHSRSKVAVLPALDQRLEDYQARFPEVIAALPAGRSGMVYLEFMACMVHRLRASFAMEEPASYRNAEEFRADVELMHRSLLQSTGENAGAARVAKLLSRLETFGFHLATLDVRQDAWLHRRVVAELLNDPDFTERGRDERTTAIDAALAARDPSAAELSEESASAMEVLRVIKKMREVHGAAAIGPYVISMAKGPDDALGLMLMAQLAGLLDREGQVALDIAPLFETVDDLDGSAATMKTLFAHPRYREHLAARGGRQVVMLGYSDSNKDAGITASRWALQKAQRELTRLCADEGIELLLFHGRGGTVSRGGGKPRNAILAQPPGSVGRRFRLTEQGEIIHAKYGLHEIASRTFELMIGAVLEARFTERPDPGPASDELMELIATRSRAAYAALMHEEPGFIAFFRDATPIDVIERLKIGSRPMARRKQEGIGDLRAIPWVFAWTQSRHVLPGWFGLGSGLKAALDAQGIGVLRELRARPEFETLLSDVEMVLAKSDMSMAARYAQLAGKAGEEIQAWILREWELTRSMILEVKEQEDLLENDQVLQRAIRLRNPYIDPMSLIQVDLLARWRATDRVDPGLERALLASVRGIARGLQNTG